MINMEIFGAWISVIFTLAILSYLYKDNPFYKASEHIFVGVSSAYWAVTFFWTQVHPNLFGRLYPSSQYQVSENIYYSKKYKKKLLYIDNTEFRDLEQIVKNCSKVICCEGAISHVSHALNKKTYALINNFKTAKFWTKHMINLELLKRDNISKICSQISNIK